MSIGSSWRCRNSSHLFSQGTCASKQCAWFQPLCLILCVMSFIKGNEISFFRGNQWPGTSHNLNLWPFLNFISIRTAQRKHLIASAMLKASFVIYCYLAEFLSNWQKYYTCWNQSWSIIGGWIYVVIWKLFKNFVTTKIGQDTKLILTDISLKCLGIILKISVIRK